MYAWRERNSIIYIVVSGTQAIVSPPSMAQNGWNHWCDQISAPLYVYTHTHIYSDTNGNGRLFIKCVISMEDPGKQNREKRKCNRINIKGAKLAEQTMKIIFSFSIFSLFRSGSCLCQYCLGFTFFFLFVCVCDSTIFILGANKKCCKITVYSIEPSITVLQMKASREREKSCLSVISFGAPTICHRCLLLLGRKSEEAQRMVYRNEIFHWLFNSHKQAWMVFICMS